MSRLTATVDSADVIKYARPFEENVLRGPGSAIGKWQALFRAGPYGHPSYEDDEDVRFYVVDITLHSPRASEIDSVEYRLDPTFYDPVRFSDDRDNDFSVELQTYGDFEVVVAVYKGKQKFIQKAYLSALLKNGYGSDPPPDVKAAIQRLVEN